jgi:O-antigen ligase
MKLTDSLPSYDKIVSRETLMIILGSLFLFTLFFPIRYVFYTNSAYATGAYSDFTSFSLYLSDIIIAIFFIFNWRRFYDNNIIYFFAVVGLWLVLTILRSTGYLPLELYFLFKFDEMFIVFLFFSDIKHLRSGGKIMLWTYLGLLFLQSLIGIYQFWAQKSLGLSFFGESFIGALVPGVAKIVSHETTFIRIYGTLPHPNILSAFLVVGLGLIAWQILEAVNRKYLLFLYISLFGALTSLVLTFSRAGYLAAAVVVAGIIAGYLVKHGFSNRMRNFVVGLILFIGLNMVLFNPFLQTRATISDDATKERIFYNQIGFKMIHDNPITGQGVGSTVLHMEQYSPVKLQPWEIQPIHNYYILTLAEIGIVGFCLLIGFFIYLLIKIVKKTTGRSSDPAVYMRRVFLTSLLLGILVLMMFDHYFYTIQSTQMLLWAILGLIFADIKRRDEKYL